MILAVLYVAYERRPLPPTSDDIDDDDDARMLFCLCAQAAKPHTGFVVFSVSVRVCSCRRFRRSIRYYYMLACMFRAYEAPPLSSSSSSRTSVYFPRSNVDINTYISKRERGSITMRACVCMSFAHDDGVTRCKRQHRSTGL